MFLILHDTIKLIGIACVYVMQVDAVTYNGLKKLRDDSRPCVNMLRVCGDCAHVVTETDGAKRRQSHHV